MIPCCQTIRCVSFGLLLASLLNIRAGAAPPASPEPPQVAEKSPSRWQASRPSAAAAERSAPDLYYLKNAAGQLVPVPDIGFEDFTRLFRLDQQLKQPPAMPAYTLDRLDLTGTVDAEERVAMTVSVTISQRRSGAIRVPLRLSPAVLRSAPQLADEQALTYDDQQGGYVFWHEGQEGDRIQLQLQLAVTVTRAGAERLFELDLPSATRSQLRLRVPGTNWTARTARGNQPIQVTRQGQLTELFASGLAGRTSIIWSTAEVNRVRRAILETESKIAVEFLGPGLAHSLASFRFVNRGGPTSAVRILLPAHARLANDLEAAQYSAIGSDVNGGEKQTVTIRFRDPLDDTQEISLPISHALTDGRRTSGQLDVADFRVLDAIRHYGRITLAAAPRWLVRWQESPTVRRVAHEDTVNDAAAAAFEFAQQPASLPVSVRRKSTRVLVEPQLTLEVQPNELAMDATFRVRIAGAPASSLQIWMTDWDIVDVSVPDEVSEDEVVTTEREPLVIPFRQPLVGEITLLIKARQPLPADQRESPDAWSFNTRLPYVVDAVSSPIALALQSPDDLTVQIDESQFDRRESRLGNTQSVAGASGVFRGDPQTDLLTCRVQIKPQVINTQLAGHVRLQERAADVVISQLSEVLHKPLGQVVYQLASDAPEDIVVRWNGEPLPPAAWMWTRALEADEGAGAKQLAVQLPQPVLGSLNIELSYRVPIEATRVAASRTVQIPLPAPTAGNVTSSEFVAVSSEYEMQPAAGNWTARSSSARKLELVSDEWTDRLTLDVRRSAVTPAPIEQLVDRLFCQTWLTKTQRQERVAFVFQSTTQVVEVRLPEYADLATLQVAVNGRAAAHQLTDRETCRVDCGGTQERVRLEMFYACTRRRRQATEPIELPSLVTGSWTRKAYWQLITPSDELLIAVPGTVDLEDRWSAVDLLQGHRSQLSQAWLESWATATRQQEPPATANQYVFSSFGTVPAARFRTCERRWLFVGSTVAILLCGLLPSLLPVLQRPATLVAIAVAFAVAAMWFPMQTVLLTPAIGLGVGLLLISRLIRWWIERAGPPRAATIPLIPARESSLPSMQSASTSITRPAPPFHVSAPDR